jgi:uncharacterized protein (TIGR02453 family)
MLQKSTLDFLNKLAKNNNKDWFDKNRLLYEAAKKDVAQFTNELIKEIALFDPTVAYLTAKDCTFRINRDVRFSKNKEPYKNNMGTYISAGGKKSMLAGYYVHIQPNGASFVAGGMYMPDATLLNNIRQEIDYNTEEFKGIINNKSFKKTFGVLQGEKLKTAPKGYEKDHPEIELLKHKSYIVTKPFTDEELLNKNLVKNIATTFKELYPLNQFLNRVVV